MKKSIPNTYIEIDNQTMGIVFDSIKYGKKVMLFDKEDFNRIKIFKWQISGLSYRNRTHYAGCRPWRSKDLAKWKIPAHRLILSFPETGELDHAHGTKP